MGYQTINIHIYTFIHIYCITTYPTLLSVSSTSSVWTAPRSQSTLSLGSSPKAIINSLLSRKSLEATQTELVDRAKKLLTIATDFTMFAGKASPFLLYVI